MATNFDTYQNNESDTTYEFERLDGNQIGCYFCKCPLQDRCYVFVQWREYYDRDILFMACHDQCPVAMIGCSVSNCHTCHREYLHMRYDGDVCVNCKDSNRNNNNNNVGIANAAH